MKILVIATFCAGAVVLQGCAHAPHERFGSVQPGDGLLSCRQLEAEIARTESVLEEANGTLSTAQVASDAAAVGAEVGGYLLTREVGDIGGLLLVDVGSKLLRGVAGAITRSSVDGALQAKANATQRKELLVQQYYAKCVLL